MSFGNSAHLATLYDQAPALAALPLIMQLTSLLGGTSHDAERLASKPFMNDELMELATWVERITSAKKEDEITANARIYWAAQALAVPFFCRTPLEDAPPDEASIQMLRAGGDALYAIGQSQFQSLRSAVSEIVAWFLAQGKSEMVLLESPLGNSVPVQVAIRLAKKAGINASIVTWNSPRNDRPSSGRTVTDSARAIAHQISASATVVFIDDAITGSRFIKTYDALQKELKGRLLPVAMVFENPETSINESSQIHRLEKRMKSAATSMQFSASIRRFPTLPLFHIDDKGPVQWSSPVIWGETDLIAGKRKVNLIFNLLDHLFYVFSDLASKNSRISVYLEKAWQRNTDGNEYMWAPGILTQTFAELTAKLDLEKLQKRLWELGLEKYPDDYRGMVLSVSAKDAKDRWDWMRSVFLELASEVLESAESWLLWRGFDNAFAASHRNVRIRPARDHAYAPFAIHYNSTVRALHEQLVHRIIEER